MQRPVHVLTFRRLLSGQIPSVKASMDEFHRDPLKLIIFPIKRDKLFVYLKHTDDLVNKRSKILAAEDWLVSKTLYFWSKLQNSPKSYNKKIVRTLNKLIDSASWQESSFLTIPGEYYILKRLHLNQEAKKDEGNQIPECRTTTSNLSLASVPTTLITHTEYRDSYPKPRLQPVNVYYPAHNGITPLSILSNLHVMTREGLSVHKKNMIRDLLLLPLTFPIVMVPLIPNIPGFYLAYRVYCNFKAYLGAKHLDTLLQRETNCVGYEDAKKNENGVSHEHCVLRFCELEPYSESIRGSGEQLSEGDVDKIVDLLSVQRVKTALLKSVRQECLATEKSTGGSTIR